MVDTVPNVTDPPFPVFCRNKYLRLEFWAMTGVATPADRVFVVVKS
jgi:hypothetical protein